MFFRKKDFLSELGSAEQDRIRFEQVGVAYKQAFASIFPLFLGASIALFLFYKTRVAMWVEIWFLLVMATLIWRIWVLIEYRKHVENESTKRWEKRFYAMMITSALLWGWVALFIFQTSNPLHQFFLIFMISGIASIASGTLASLFGLSILFLILLLAPLFVVIFFHGGLEFQMMGILVLTFFILLVSAASRIHKNIMSALVSKILHEKATAALALSEEHFETIFKEAPAGIFYYNSDLIVIDSNMEMLQILRIDREEFIGMDLKKLSDNSLYEALVEPIHGDKGYYEGAYTSMIQKLHLWITLRTSPMYDTKHNIIGGVAIVTDITERIVAEEKVKHQAYYDALTDIPNRILLRDRIEQSLAHHRRYRSLIAVMFLDLDHFKSINDSLGHHIGDMILIETASRLSSICREGDTVSRLGGDEFVILLNELGTDPHVAATRAESVAEKIHAILTLPFETGQVEPLITSTSIGIALVGSDDQSADDLLKFADTAMYQAKKEGRNTTRFYQEQMDQWIKKRLFMENALRHAIKNNELELYYQPVIEIATKRIIGAEALLRWNHPEMGLVMPDEMISIAEESGLIVPIGEWVLREACTQFVRWRADRVGKSHIERIAINVSAVQFRQSDFVDKVIRIVAESGIVPSMLELELTESMIIDKIDTVIEKMNRLRTAGIGLSMDDFGTGYSSLAYLKRLPFTTLKIDRSFVRDIMLDKDDAALVETILSIASIFNLDVIAEGVETIEQFNFLENHGCSYFQGYLCSKPVQVPTFEELLSYDVQSCHTRR
ncbi:putative bifunctional diguanylate cyclase/phosphodiesterase [Sulfuricurvum sp.]|uniref:putative bifunctional diguanylate cyclase/phosphodiesterase n=1 Tax=Sulfuricurvum sp. TaxID=2025608 RepID=UPI002E34338A|nr:EAL domain-containing protein [Sulfuricurvum sp.]HEX5329336.1 EAL domain-containing protein [Sulfuricurvum sp.]